MAKNLVAHAATHSAPVPSAPPLAQDTTRGPRILARSLYKSLKAQGYTPRQIVAITTELIGLVTADLPQQLTPTQRPQS